VTPAIELTSAVTSGANFVPTIFNSPDIKAASRPIFFFLKDASSISCWCPWERARQPFCVPKFLLYKQFFLSLFTASPGSIMM